MAGPWAVFERVKLSAEPSHAAKRAALVLGRMTDYEVIVAQAYEIARLRRELEGGQAEKPARTP